MTAGQLVFHRTVQSTGHSPLWYRVADWSITGLAMSFAVAAILYGLAM